MESAVMAGTVMASRLIMSFRAMILCLECKATFALWLAIQLDTL
jgi:hypothetical protein